MKSKILLLTLIFMVIGTTVFSQPKPTGDILDVLNNFSISDENRKRLIAFINNTLEHKGVAFYEVLPSEYHGVSYRYDTNRKYLFVTEVEYGASAGSWEDERLYIFDIELIRLIPNDGIFVNISAPAFKNLMIEYLSKHPAFDRIDQYFLTNPWPGELFFSKGGIGMKWGRGTISARAWSFEIVLPYSRVEQFLTPVGKDVFR